MQGHPPITIRIAAPFELEETPLQLALLEVWADVFDHTGEVTRGEEPITIGVKPAREIEIETYADNT